MKQTKIEIEIPDGKMAKWVNNVLTLVDDIDEKSQYIMERIKTFDDALAELRDRAEHGDEEAEVLVNEYDNVYSICIKCSKDLLAYLKLRIITYALNEGWKPKSSEEERLWYPWFQLDRSRGSDNASIVYKNAGYVYSDLFAYFGPRLALKRANLAEYAGNQFIDIYADYLFNPNERLEPELSKNEVDTTEQQIKTR